MRNPIRTLSSLALPAAAAVVALAGTYETPPSREIVALEEGGRLVRFRTDDPGVILSEVRLFSEQPVQGEPRLLAVAMRPATGELYGITNTMYLARIDTRTGTLALLPHRILDRVSAIGSQYLWLVFDPVRDQARVVDAYGRQLRVDPDTGHAIVSEGHDPAKGGDADWRWAEGDPTDDGSGPPQPLGLAVARDAATGEVTTYGIIRQGTAGNVLVRVGDAGDARSADTGVVHTVAAFGDFPGGGVAPFGFVVADGVAFLEVAFPDSSGTGVVLFDLETGAWGPRWELPLHASEPWANRIGITGKANFHALAEASDVLPWPAPPVRDPDPSPGPGTDPVPGPDTRPVPDPEAPVVVNDGRVHIDFDDPSSSTALVRGTVRGGTPAAGSIVRVSIGSAERTFLLDGRRRGAEGGDRIRFRRARRGAVRFTAVLGGEGVARAMPVPTRGARLDVPVVLESDTASAADEVPLVFDRVTAAAADGAFER